jgi:hypothetical protein
MKASNTIFSAAVALAMSAGAVIAKLKYIGGMPWEAQTVSALTR